MSKLVSPRGGRQPTGDGLGKDKKAKSSKLLGWGRSTPSKHKEPVQNTKNQNQNVASPRTDPSNHRPRASILLGKDAFVPISPVSPQPKKNPEPIGSPLRVSKEERLSILAPQMATTSRHDEEKAYWKNTGSQQQQWRKSVLKHNNHEQSPFTPRDDAYVPPHSKRARGTISRPLPPTSSPPSKPATTDRPSPFIRQNSASRPPLRPMASLGARRENTGGGIPPKPMAVTVSKPAHDLRGSTDSSRDASPQPTRQTSIYGIAFDERLLADPDFGDATVELPPLEHSFTLRPFDDDFDDPQFDIDSGEDDPVAAANYRASLYQLERDITFLTDETQEYIEPSRMGISDLQRDVTFGDEDPPQFALPDLERDVTFADQYFDRDPDEAAFMRDVTFSTAGEDDLAGLEREVSFNETQTFVDEFLNTVGDLNFDEFGSGLDSQSKQTPSRSGLNRNLTLGGLKNMAFDLDFDLNVDGFGGSQEESESRSSEYSRTESDPEDDDPSFDDSESEDEEIEVGPGTEVTLKYKLGRGATATVWCGMVDANIVAIKQITLKSYKEGIESAKIVVKKEYDMIRSISHPSIIKYHGLFYDKEAEEVNIVMQMITGVLITDLVLYVEQVPEDISAFLLHQIIGGFIYLHAVANVIHRDLKPDNVLLDTHGRIKIIDFGTATSFESSKEAKRRSTVGTPWYCAPEILNDEEYTTTCDVWSLGCFTLELVTGKPPFDNLNATSCLFQMSQGVPPPIPKTVSDPCGSFLHCCLDPDWTMRPSMQKLQQHPFITNQPKKAQLKQTIRELIKEMLAVKKEKDKMKLKESPTQIADDRLTFNFGPS